MCLVKERFFAPEKFYKSIVLMQEPNCPVGLLWTLISAGTARRNCL